MSSGDFLHRNAETQLSERYLAAGAVCSLSTNSEKILQAAREAFLPVDPPFPTDDFCVRLWVDSADQAQPPWPKPYVRGLDHMVFAGFDAGSSMVANLRTRRVIGRFSPAMAADTAYWRSIIFPMLMSLVSGSVGLVELHACCVAKDERGLILIGPSRSGKSTLAMALTEVGFRLLSDDRVFCSVRNGQLQACGIPRPLKLRPEAAHWFDDFRHREPTDVQNGELVFHCDPNRFGRHLPKCEPRLLVFLERQEAPVFSMTHLEGSEARTRIERDLLAESPEAAKDQAKIVDRLMSIPRGHLKYGGRPQEIAEQLQATFLESSEQQAPGRPA
jgi:hypothetical protein